MAMVDRQVTRLEGEFAWANERLAKLEAVAELARRCHKEMPLNDGTCELIYDLGDRLDELDGKEVDNA